MKVSKAPRHAPEIPINAPDANTAVTARKPDPPPGSWWLGAASREDFAQRHAQQLPRMQGEKFGTRRMLITPPAGT